MEEVINKLLLDDELLKLTNGQIKPFGQLCITGGLTYEFSLNSSNGIRSVDRLIHAVNGEGRKEVPWHFIGPDGEWWHTKGQKPNPFLQDAIDSNLQNALKAFGEGAEVEWRK